MYYEEMNTHTDPVRREYEALYLNRNALRAHAKAVLRRVPGVPVDDVLDEAFLALWQDITDDSVDGPLSQHIRKYIDRAGWKLARRAIREHLNEWQYGLDPGEPLSTSDDLDLYGYRELTPERAAFGAAFDNAVRSLTPKQREAYILTELRGLSQREAADILGISRESVRDRVEGAAEAMREMLGGAA